MTNFWIAVGLVAGIWTLALVTVVVLLGVVNKYITTTTPEESVRETLLFSSKDGY
jgi:hypothetical protein